LLKQQSVQPVCTAELMHALTSPVDPIEILRELQAERGQRERRDTVVRLFSSCVNGAVVFLFWCLSKSAFFDIPKLLNTHTDYMS
jgi:hypothetical protein